MRKTSIAAAVGLAAALAMQETMGTATSLRRGELGRIDGPTIVEAPPRHLVRHGSLRHHSDNKFAGMSGSGDRECARRLRQQMKRQREA